MNWKIKYSKNPQKCAECNSDLPYKKRMNKFCNHICSAKYTNQRRQRKRKNGLLTGETFNKICTLCNSDYKTDELHQKFCSRACGGKSHKKKNITCPICKEQKAIRRKLCSNCDLGVRNYTGKRLAIEQLGSKCFRCGWMGDPIGFDFHHLKDKLKKVSLLFHSNQEDFRRELAKCELLCCYCHRKEHVSVNFDKFINELNVKSFERSKRLYDNNANKICNICSKRFQSKGNRCPSCRTYIRKLKNKYWAVEQLGGKCKNCGWIGHYSAFDFHHPNQNYDYRISEISGHSRSNIQKELDKAILLCVLCHRQHHAKTRSREFDEFVTIFTRRLINTR